MAAVVMAALPASAGAAESARITAERRLGPRSVELTITTPAFTEPTRVQVFLPAMYDDDPSRRWPVTYYLHGANGDEKRFAPWYGDLIRDVPSIFVAPAGGAIGFYSDWYNDGAGGPPMYETYDIDQLIPLIDQRFRTTGTRAGRALIGESMGGFGVMTYASRHPDLFATAVSLSGAVDSNHPGAIALVSAGPPIQGGQPNAIWGPRTTQEVRWHGHNPVDLADNLHDVDLQVRTSEGVPDPSIESPGEGTASDCTLERGIFQMSDAFHQRLVALGVAHVWKDYVGGCHTIPNFRREFRDALPGLEQALAHPRPEPTTFSYRSIEPRFTIWGWRVEADPQRAPEFLQLRDAGRGGVTLAGSGTATVTTPAFFAGLRAVDVGGRVLAPDRAGRLRFTVDLGTRRAVTFAPHARLVLKRARGHRLCVRSIGPAVHGIRITVLDGRRRRFAARCVRARHARATATDAFGHRVAARR